MALLLTFCSGLFFLLGIIVYQIVPNKTKFSKFSIACACVVILGLICGDLVPELIEIGNYLSILFVIVGLVFLILIDKLIPYHTHEHHENDEEEEDHVGHMEHISLITIIALLLHNMIEGMALYGVSVGDTKSGVLMLLGIGLHNLPFGFQIASNGNKKSIPWIIFLVLSGFIGGLIFKIFGSFSATLEMMIISLTCGMLIHILVFELLGEVKREIKKKETIYGLGVGAIIVLLINLL